MAQDGSQPWEGKGAFPYLLHHPRDPQQTSSYAQQRGHGVANSETASQGTAKTGTWDGPAPKGMRAAAEGSRAGSHGQASTSQSSVITLPGGTALPLIGFGTYTIKSADIVRTALAAGYRHFDCASKYGNEDVIGEGLKDFIAKEGRESLFITSKIWNDAHRPEEARKSVAKTLSDLGCGYLDLLLIHWPESWIPGTQDPDTTVTTEQTWEALEGLVKEGKVKHIGVSNFSLAQVEKLLETASIKPVVNQVELHPLLAQRKLVGTCLRKGVHSVAYSPLGHGSGGLFDLPAVKEIAEEVGKSPAQVVLKWNVQRGVVVIPRSQSEKNIRGNIEGLFDWSLTQEQKSRLDALDIGKRTVDSDWHDWGDPLEGGATKPTDVLR